MKNNKIERVLGNIVCFLQKSMGTGTTTMLIEVASQYDCTVLVSKEEDKKLYEQSVNVNCIKDKDTTTNPILIEKEVLFDIATDALSYIEALKKEVANLKIALNKEKQWAKYLSEKWGEVEE